MKIFCCLAGLMAFTALAQTQEQPLNGFIAATPHPASISDFQAIPHLPSRPQGKTMICWSVATSSLLESEMARLRMEPVRLSTIYPLYCAFVEKAKCFVKTKGASRFAAGDLFTGVLDINAKYGAIPRNVYGGQEHGEMFDHKKLYAELDDLMKRIKARGDWNETRVLGEVKSVLDRHLGKPPETFSFAEKTFTPQSFLRENVKLRLDDYVLVTSFSYAPFHQFIELKVPDNWRRHSNYFNVPLDVFYGSLKEAVQAGYSVAIDADFSEPSYKLTKTYGIIPDYEIPRSELTQKTRERMFSTGATTDDHLMHIVGYKNLKGQDWFLIKDSWHVAWENKTPGYVFFHESYVKLKVLAFLVHKDGVPQIKELMTKSRH